MNFFVNRLYPLELREDLFRIPVIDLIEDHVWQLDSVYFPTPLLRISVIIEIFISGFQPTEVIAVHLLITTRIGAEQDAIRIGEEQFPCLAWLAPEFCLTRPKLHVKIRVFRE